MRVTLATLLLSSLSLYAATAADEGIPATTAQEATQEVPQETAANTAPKKPRAAKKKPVSLENLKVKLVEPTYKNGVLSTKKGGVIRGKDFTLQAQEIEYVRTSREHAISARGKLLFTFQGRTYTGDTISIDLNTQKSIITNGCTSIPPMWFVGGKVVEIDKNGKGTIYDAYLTSSENEKNDWSMRAKEVDISKGIHLKAKRVRFLFVHIPIFWLPSLSSNLKYSNPTPFRYHFRYRGRLGPRLNITYDLMRYKYFKATAMADILFKRGLGGGLHTEYDNPHTKEYFYTLSYAAHDFISKEEHKYLRYRFKGGYSRPLFYNMHCKASYDKLSDMDMRSDYATDQLETHRIDPTQVMFSKKAPDWISTLNTKVRLNSFQTIKQELPLFTTTTRPLTLGSSRILVANNFEAGFLDYKYARHTPHVHDFHSSRVAFSQKLYRHFLLPGIQCTPYAGYTAISYNNSPQHISRLLAIGTCGVEAHTRFERIPPHHKGLQAVEPYVHYEYLTTPSVASHKHYLFDFNDGWHRLNTLRFGLKNFFITEGKDGFTKQLQADIYSRAFINTPTIGRNIPRVYSDIVWKATPRSRYFVNMAWDIQRKDWDQLNIGSALTVSDDVAFTVEWRHRNAYHFRKMDPQNFIIDSQRTEHRLRHSEMSDRRDAILTEMFIRFSPILAVNLMTRNGYGRERHHQPAYQAYQIDFITLLRGALNITFSVQYRSKYDHWSWKHLRYSIDARLGPPRPHFSSEIHKIGQGNYTN